MPALYLSQSIETAVMEANQGFANKIEPCVLVSYEVDCEPVADLTTEAARAAVSADPAAMSCPWLLDTSMAKVPASWILARRLVSEGWAGALVPSFAARAAAHDVNLVLWTWGPDLPRRVQVFDPHERLPKDQRSWG
jgi:RES domain-containing protein